MKRTVPKTFLVLFAIACSTINSIRAQELRSGDPLPKGAIVRMGTLSFRGSDTVVFSAAGKLVGASGGKSVSLWDATTGKETLKVPHYEYIPGTLALSSDDAILATGGEGRIQLWNTKTGKEIRSFGKDMGGIDRLVFSHDNKRLFSASGDGDLRIWEIATGNEKSKIKGLRPRDIAVSPDGKWLAVADISSTVTMRDPGTGKIVAKLAGHKDAVESLAFSRDGAFVAAGGSDGVILVWDANTHKPVSRLLGHTDRVSAVVFSSDGKNLASGSRDYSIRIWSIDAQKPRHAMKGTSWVTHLAASPNGKHFASTDKSPGIRFWDFDTGREFFPVSGHQGEICGVAYSPDGKTLISAALDGTIRFWEAEKGEETRRIEKPGAEFESVAVSNDGQWVACSGRSLVPHVWESKSGKLLNTLGEARAHCVAFSADAKYVAADQGFDRVISLWDFRNAKKVREFKGFDSWIDSMAFSLDGKLFAAASGDRRVHV